MESKKIVNNISKVIMSFLLGGLILYWMYRGFDFKKMEYVLFHEMNWTWMILSFPFGILAQMFRGWRWKQVLEPVHEHSRTSVRINSIFISYAASLVIPRIGEFARCGILKRYDHISFPKALGTVVTERAIDSFLVILITLTTILSQASVFKVFFSKTGTSMESVIHHFSVTGYIVTGICALAAGILIWYLLKRLTIYEKVKNTFSSIMTGVMSLKNVHNVPLFILLTLSIWISYFLHYYLTFFCFDATAHLSVMCAMVTFIVGSIAVIVPTPNGAGPWHFAVKTMLILYGVHESDALYFVLIVHSIQTLLVILLGIYGWIALSFTKIKHLNNIAL